MVLNDRHDAIEDYIAFFAQHDTQGQAIMAEQIDSPHPLSIQRMRNIGQIADDPTGYVKRWLPMLYTNMEIEALERQTSIAGKFPDAALAKKILSERHQIPN